MAGNSQRPLLCEPVLEYYQFRYASSQACFSNSLQVKFLTPPTDLWEELDGTSFFTTIMQHRALVEGTNLAREFGLTCCNCASQAPQVLCFLQAYWNNTYVNSNLAESRTGIDASSILGSIHTFDPEAECDDTTFQPCSPRALANHKAITDVFREIYQVNSGIEQGEAVAVGRYPTDHYFNGNPWYVTTFAAAEQLYDAIYQWKQLGEIKVTDISLPFFKDVYSPIRVGTYIESEPRFDSIISAVKTYADGFMKVAVRVPTMMGSKDNLHLLYADSSI